MIILNDEESQISYLTLFQYDFETNLSGKILTDLGLSWVLCNDCYIHQFDTTSTLYVWTLEC